MGKAEMSVEISLQKEGTETHLDHWLHVSIEMVGSRFVCSILGLLGTHRIYDVPGKGSSV